MEFQVKVKKRSRFQAFHIKPALNLELGTWNRFTGKPAAI
jgi:hypothetical protein